MLNLFYFILSKKGLSRSAMVKATEIWRISQFLIEINCLKNKKSVDKTLVVWSLIYHSEVQMEHVSESTL